MLFRKRATVVNPPTDTSSTTHAISHEPGAASVARQNVVERVDHDLPRRCGSGTVTSIFAGVCPFSAPVQTGDVAAHVEVDRNDGAETGGYELLRTVPRILYLPPPASVACTSLLSFGISMPSTHCEKK